MESLIFHQQLLFLVIFLPMKSNILLLLHVVMYNIFHLCFMVDCAYNLHKIGYFCISFLFDLFDIVIYLDLI